MKAKKKSLSGANQPFFQKHKNAKWLLLFLFAELLAFILISKISDHQVDQAYLAKDASIRLMSSEIANKKMVPTPSITRK